jgi:hypothetical protein
MLSGGSLDSSKQSQPLLYYVNLSVCLYLFYRKSNYEKLNFKEEAVFPFSVDYKLDFMKRNELSFTVTGDYRKDQQQSRDLANKRNIFVFENRRKTQPNYK